MQSNPERLFVAHAMVNFPFVCFNVVNYLNLYGYDVYIENDSTYFINIKNNAFVLFWSLFTFHETRYA